MNKNLKKLKASLNDAILTWLNDVVGEDEDLTEALETFISDDVSELMTDSAFNILLAQRDLTKYYRDQELLE